MSASVVITGGCGFLGSALARKIAAEGVTLADGRHVSEVAIHLWDRPGVVVPTGINARFNAIDIADPTAVAAAMPDDVVLIYHLAAVVSGQAEADFDLGMRVNLAGTQAMLSAAREKAAGVTLVGTSSLAVYGGDVAEPLTEATATQPQNTYGVSKAMAELLMADYRRRDWVDARTLRLPTVTVRPGRPNAAASSFASSIIREPLSGQRAQCPVSPDLALWVTSPDAAVHALWHAPSVARESWPDFGAVNVPGLTVTVAEMIAALRRAAGDDAVALIDMQPDARISQIVGTWPARFETGLADRLGFQGDSGLDDILDQALRMK